MVTPRQFTQRISPKLRQLCTGLGVTAILLLGVNAFAPREMKPNAWTTLLSLASVTCAMGYAAQEKETTTELKLEQIGDAESLGERTTGLANPAPMLKDPQVEQVKKECALRFAQEAMRSGSSEVFWANVEKGNEFMNNVRSLTRTEAVSNPINRNALDYTTVQTLHLMQQQSEIAGSSQTSPATQATDTQPIEEPYENHNNRSSSPYEYAQPVVQAAQTQRYTDPYRENSDLWGDEETTIDGLVQHQLEEELV